MNEFDMKTAKECEDYLLKIRHELGNIDFPDGMSEYAIACPEGIYDLVMELKNMYLKSKRETTIYRIHLKGYDHVFTIDTNEYNLEISKLLKWAYPYYDIISVIEGGKSLVNTKYLHNSKAEVLEDVQIRIATYFYDDIDEVLQANMKKLDQLLIDDK